MVSLQDDVDQILRAVRILESEHLGAAAGEVYHGLGCRASLQGLVAAGQLCVSFLEKRRPELGFRFGVHEHLGIQYFENN